MIYPQHNLSDKYVDTPFYETITDTKLQGKYFWNPQ